MNRRGFLGSILALGAAPAIVRADSLMRIVPVETTIDLSYLEGDMARAIGVFETSDLVLSLDEYAREYIYPALNRLSE